MASEVQSKKKSQSDELAQMQVDYTRKRKQLMDQQNRDLDSLRENYDASVTDVRDRSEAAVNHIKKNNERSISSLKEQNKSQIDIETQNGRKSYNEIKKYNDTVKQNLKKNLDMEEAHLQGKIQDLGRKESEFRTQQSKTTTDYLQKQADSVNKAERKAREELNTIKVKSSETQRVELEKNNARLKRLGDEYRELYKKEQTLKETELGRRRQQSEQALEQLRIRGNDQINKEKERGQTTAEQTRQRYENIKAKEAKQGEELITHVKNENTQKLRYEDKKNQEQKLKLQKEYETEINRIDKNGQRVVAETTNTYDTQLKRQKEEFDFEDNKMKDQHKNLTEAQSERFRTHRQKNAEVYQDNLKRQNEQFQSRFKNTEKAHKQSIGNQDELYNVALTKLKKEQLGQVEQIETRKEDPFYKLQNRGTEFIENSSEYRIRAYIPDHEKNNVRIRIQDDKAVVSGARSFEEKINDKNKVVSTNNYQTFKEEFQFGKPVVKNAVEQIRDGNTVEFIIPKLLNYSKKA